MKTVKEILKIKCPFQTCDVYVKSKHGLTLHMNAIHVVMSPNQIKMMKQSLTCRRKQVVL